MSRTKTESWECLEEEAKQQEEQKCREYLEWYNNSKMEAKDKAKELVDKYWKIDTQNDYWTVGLDLGGKMATIAVDEILQLEVDQEYWKLVKLEIRKYLL